MKRKPPCTIGWCTADHADDNERIAHHRATVDAQTIDSTTVCVVVLWAERLDGRASVLPHIAVIASGSPDALHTDLTPREASAWSALLTATRSRPWLAEALAAGAEMLAPHDDREHDGQPHRVALDLTDNAVADILLRGAVDAARSALDGFNRYPTGSMDPIHLVRWVGEFRAALIVLAEAVEGAQR